MRSLRTLTLALALLLAPAAAAGAATISTSATEVDYTGGAGDRIAMHVYSAWDDELHDSAAFFLPNDATIVDPTTADANCRTRPTGASSCLQRSLTRIVTQGQDDFVAVDQAGDTVRFDAGAGNDRVFVTGGSKLQAYGQDGDDDLAGGTGFDILDGGPGDDKLSPYKGGDDVHGGTGFDTAQMENGSGVVVTLDEVADDGASGENENIHSDVERVVGGNGADELDGNAGANTLEGRDGNDTVNGLGGADTLSGGNGDDLIQARDGAPDTVACGPGTDKAIVDPADTVAPDCETVALPDAGVTAPAPGGGGGATPGGGTTPGGGGTVTAGRTAPRPMPARIADRWTVTDAWARVDRLTVRNAPKGAAVTVTCHGGGCPLARRALKVRAGRADAGRAFGHRHLRPGATVQVTVTAAGYAGKAMRYRFAGHSRVPAGRIICLPAGAHC
jgi:RTX calcium-binding nonapeptide repeat (4 copies)